MNTVPAPGPDAILLHECSESNIAGFSWVTRVYLVPDESDPLRLVVHTESIGDDEESEPRTTEVRGVVTALNLVRAIEWAMQDHGHSEWPLATPLDVTALADALESTAPELATDLRGGLERLLEREQREEEAAAELARSQRARTLEPFRARIEAYLEGISDERLHYPGRGRVYPSRRHWTRVFLENFVITHGHLPRGTHNIVVESPSSKTSLGSQDFGDFFYEGGTS